MTFAHPIALACAVALPLIWWTGRHARTRAGRMRLALRLTAAASLVAAAAGVAAATAEPPVTVAVALDRSASVPVAAQRGDLARVNGFRSAMRPADRMAVIAFAGEALAAGEAVDGSRAVAVPPLVATGATNIGAAIRRARAALPASGARRIVVVSDGRETVGVAGREALLAAAAGIPVDVLPSTAGSAPQLRLAAVTAPGDVASAEPFSVAVQVAGRPGAAGQVTLYRDDEVVGSADVIVDGGGTGSASFAERIGVVGRHTYLAALKDEDTSLQPSGAVVNVVGATRLLYVATETAVLAGVLGAAGFDIVRVQPSSLPVSEAGLSGYAAVVLDGVAANELPTAGLDSLRQFVERRGGGLLLLGSAQTLAADGYPAGPLGPILPLDLRPRSGERAPPLGVVVVFDKSGSMADRSEGVSKIEVARQAVGGVLEVLPSGDAFGVIAFDTTPTPISPLASGHDKGALVARLNAVTPGGATAIAPAVDLAVQWLSSSPAPMSRRQILLLSDGRTSAADASRLRAIVRDGGVQLSVIAIGGSADQGLLQELATASGGRAYFPADVRELPRLAAREATRSSGGRLFEEWFTPHALPHAALAGIDVGRLPPLHGYVVTTLKPTGNALLASHLDDPLLAAGRAGLGRVVVFTADLGSPRSALLRAWPNYPRLWAQTMRWVSGGADVRGWQVQLADSDEGPVLRLDASTADGEPADLEEVHAAVRTSTGDAREVPLEPRLPGVYEAALPDPAAGAYTVAVTGRQAPGGTELRVVRTLFWTAERELVQGAESSRLAATGACRWRHPAPGRGEPIRCAATAWLRRHLGRGGRPRARLVPVRRRCWPQRSRQPALAAHALGRRSLGTPCRRVSIRGSRRMAAGACPHRP